MADPRGEIRPVPLHGTLAIELDPLQELCLGTLARNSAEERQASSAGTEHGIECCSGRLGKRHPVDDLDSDMKIPAVTA